MLESILVCFGMISSNCLCAVSVLIIINYGFVFNFELELVYVLVAPGFMFWFWKSFWFRLSFLNFDNSFGCFSSLVSDFGHATGVGFSKRFCPGFESSFGFQIFEC